MGPNCFEVTEAARLLEFLFASLPERSRTAVKSLLAHRSVLVDGEAITQFDHPLSKGQTVEIRGAATAGQKPGGPIQIVFEDAHLVVIEKRAGLLSIATDTQRERTAYSLLSEQVKKSNSRNRIFIVHRLDRETSGLMMFAKNQSAQAALQSDWNEAVLERKYVAIVEGRVTTSEGTITSWLKENKSLIMCSSQVPGDGQKAITHYRVLKSSPKFSLLEVTLETGRKNQIRVHLQQLGHSVIGDVKYGATENPIRRLGLHAKILSFLHPITGKPLRFESPLPLEFRRLFPS